LLMARVLIERQRVPVPQRWRRFFAVPVTLRAAYHPDRDEHVVEVQSGDVVTRYRCDWPLRIPMPDPAEMAARCEFEAMMRHWWAVAHSRGGYC
jgi:hypothetical protein